MLKKSEYLVLGQGLVGTHSNCSRKWVLAWLTEMLQCVGIAYISHYQSSISCYELNQVCYVRDGDKKYLNCMIMEKHYQAQQGLCILKRANSLFLIE